MSNRINHPSVSQKLLVYLLLTSLVLVMLHVLFKYISIVIFDEKHGFLFELSNRLDLNDENSLPQWFTQVIFLVIAFLAYLAYRFTLVNEGSSLWLVIAGLGVLLSVDDVATLHEFGLQNLHNTFFEDMKSTFLVNSWILLLPFIVAGLGVLIYKAYRLLPVRTYGLIAVGGVIYVVGAVLVDSLTNNFLGRAFIEQGVMGGIEGGLQLIGSAVFLYAIADYLELYHRKQVVAVRNLLKPAPRSKAKV
ncbi:hypothetical protein KC867_00295 [Candidatus Saccharibacteria bacterium]|nr:hypothetical protein [Candidatus Saccharibacteria bacterium]